MKHQRADLLDTRRLRLLHELSLRRASLEEAFMDLTRDSVEFHGGTASDTAPHTAEERVAA